jgi:eukaryotic-like serine/threonine-protein kinase
METRKFASEGGSGGSLQIGSVLQSRYKITSILGVGGMGSVYLARDMNFPTVTRNVAVKEMLNMMADPKMRETTLANFEREANLLAELTHAAIPKIYDYFSSKERAYLVMEYINGRDLEAILSSVPDFLPFDMVKRWALELCDVLAYLHSRPVPIIFRDMKPSNVMIDSNGAVRLIDFGIAKTFQAEQKGTQIGTEGYSPPEQYRGEATPSGDVYALGATLHHILTKIDPRGQAPFSFNERPLRDSNPNVPDGFAKIVMQAVQYNSSERFPSAAAMKNAIESSDRAAGARSAIASPTPAAGRTQMINTPGGTITLEEPDINPPGLQAVWQFRAEEEIRGTPVFHRGTVYVGCYDNNLYAVNSTDGAFKWKFSSEGGISTTPSLFLEENAVIFGSDDGNLYAIDMRTGKIKWTFKTAAPIRSSVNLVHGHAFFGSDDGRLYAVRVQNGNLAWKWEGGSPIRSKPAVTAERIVVGMEGGDVVGLDLAGSIKWRYKARRPVTSSPLVHDNIAYFGSMDMQVYAVDVQQGWKIWQYRTQNGIISSPAIQGRQLFIGSADNFLYTLDIGANGREMWKFKTEGQVIASPVVVNDAVYVGSVDGHLYSLETKKGALRWKFRTKAPITSAIAVGDTLLYVGSTDHFLYALNL